MQMPKTLWMLGDSNLLMVSTSLVKISLTSLTRKVKGQRPKPAAAWEARGFFLGYLGLVCIWSAYLLMATWKPWYSPL